MLDFIRIKLHCLGLILKNSRCLPASQTAGMFLSYLAMVTVYVFAVKLLGFRPASFKAAGYKFNFYSLRVFINLFEEIFIHGNYHFTTACAAPVIIDCGSNIGVSVLYFKTLYPGAAITAFEADADAFRLLEKNIKDNKLQNVTAINRALYAVKGEKLKFYSNLTDSANPVNSLVKRPDEFKFKEPVEVLTETLSGYVKGKVDFLKMDIEGAEYGVIKEMREKLGLIDRCVLEYHHHLEPERDMLAQMLGIFEEKGFGYQISTWLKPPFTEKKFQDLNIYFYKK